MRRLIGPVFVLRPFAAGELSGNHHHAVIGAVDNLGITADVSVPQLCPACVASQQVPMLADQGTYCVPQYATGVSDL